MKYIKNVKTVVKNGKVYVEGSEPMKATEKVVKYNKNRTGMAEAIGMDGSEVVYIKWSDDVKPLTNTSAPQREKPSNDYWASKDERIKRLALLNTATEILKTHKKSLDAKEVIETAEILARWVQ